MYMGNGQLKNTIIKIPIIIMFVLMYLCATHTLSYIITFHANNNYAGAFYLFILRKSISILHAEFALFLKFPL